MFRPIAINIGLRYTRSKRRQHFVSFISLVSVFGIALGIAVLITVLSVMNGFDQQIKQRVFTMIPQMTVSGFDGKLSNWQQVDKKIKTVPQVQGSAPYVSGEGLLSASGATQAALVSGIDPKLESSVTDLGGKMVQGKMGSLTKGSYNIVLGQGIAMQLGLGVGDKVIMMIPEGSVTPVGFVPRFKRFTVSGIFHAGSGFNFDSGYVFINLNDAQVLFKLGSAVSGVRLKVADPFTAPQLAFSMQKVLGSNVQISDWSSSLGAFFHAVALEKNMMFLILMLIIAVAAFNLVCTLVMVVNEKRADIAILRTLGATPRSIMGIFIVQGGVIGLVGVALGIIFGILLADNVTSIVNFIQNVFHVQFISSSVYIVDYLPSKLEWGDVWRVCSIALGLSLLATIYPAWHASRTQPAEALRYE